MDQALVPGSVVVGSFKQSERDGGWGYRARHSSEHCVCLPDAKRPPELGIKKSGSGPAFSPCPAMELIAKSNSWLLAGNAGSRIFSG